MKIDIENFAEEQGKKIANAVMLKNDEYPSLLGKERNPIEAGATPNPTIDTVKKIADALGVSLDVLIK